MMLPGSGVAGCSASARQRSVSKPTVRTVATLNPCPVAAQLRWLARKTVPASRACAVLWAGSPKTPYEMNDSAAILGGHDQPRSA